MQFEEAARLILQGMIPGTVPEDTGAWVGDIVAKSLSSLGPEEWGVIFVPQFGTYAGGYQTHSANESKRENRINNQIVKAMETPEPEKAFHRIEAIYGIKTVPVEKNFTSPIGVIWYSASGPDFAALNQIQLVADLISVIVLNDKYNIAFKLLAEDDWSDVSQYHKTFQKVAERCREAIHCADVTIWLKSSNDLLKSVGTTSTGKIDMHIGNGLAGNIFFHDDPVIVNRLTDRSEVEMYSPKGVAHEDVVKRKRWRSACFVPLRIGDERIGVTAVYSKRFMGINNVDKAIAVAFCQKLCTSYTQVNKLIELQNMEKKLHAIAPTISASLVSMAQVHDAKNILNFLQSEIGKITKRNEREKESVNYKSGALSATYVTRLQKILKRIGDHTQATTDRREKHDISEIVGEIFEFASKSTDVEIRFLNKIPKGTIIKCDGIAIERLVTNIVANSVYFLEDDLKPGSKKIEAKLEGRDRNFVHVTITDNGIGMTTQSIERLFEYTFTTKPNEGMGFGLAISNQIVLAHGGDLIFESELGEWTKASILLPVEGRVVKLGIDAVLGGDVF